MENKIRILSDVYQCFEINAPSWFSRDDFQKWLNEPFTATWHKKGEPPNEMSDVFLTFDHKEGSDAEDLPEDIWENICELVGPRCDFCVIRITNLQE